MLLVKSCLQCLDVERLLPDQLLQPAIHAFHCFQTLDFGRTHATVLGFPTVKGLFTDAWRQISVTFKPASCCFRIRVICSGEYLFGFAISSSPVFQFTENSLWAF